MAVRGWLGSTREGVGSGRRFCGSPFRPQCMEPTQYGSVRDRCFLLPPALKRCEGFLGAPIMPSNQTPQLSEETPDEQTGLLRNIRVGVIGLFLIALIGLIYFARDFLLPVLLAFLLALTLSPIVRYMQKRGVAPSLSALVLVLIMLGVFSAGAYLLTDPVTEWIERAPKISQRVQQKLAALRRPVEAVVKP